MNDKTKAYFCSVCIIGCASNDPPKMVDHSSSSVDHLFSPVNSWHMCEDWGSAAFSGLNEDIMFSTYQLFDKLCDKNNHTLIKKDSKNVFEPEKPFSYLGWSIYDPKQVSQTQNDIYALSWLLSFHSKNNSFSKEEALEVNGETIEWFINQSEADLMKAFIPHIQLLEYVENWSKLYDKKLKSELSNCMETSNRSPTNVASWKACWNQIINIHGETNYTPVPFLKTYKTSLMDLIKSYHSVSFEQADIEEVMWKRFWLFQVPALLEGQEIELPNHDNHMEYVEKFRIWWENDLELPHLEILINSSQITIKVRDLPDEYKKYSKGCLDLLSYFQSDLNAGHEYLRELFYVFRRALNQKQNYDMEMHIIDSNKHKLFLSDCLEYEQNWKKDYIEAIKAQIILADMIENWEYVYKAFSENENTSYLGCALSERRFPGCLDSMSRPRVQITRALLSQNTDHSGPLSLLLSIDHILYMMPNTITPEPETLFWTPRSLIESQAL